MNIEIGAYEAKTRLPELLRNVRSGNRYTITVRGVAVAELVPAQGAGGNSAVAAAVEKMRAFMLAQQPQEEDVKALIDEGRA